MDNDSNDSNDSNKSNETNQTNQSNDNIIKSFFNQTESNESNASEGVYMSFEQKMEKLIHFYNKYTESSEQATVSSKQPNNKKKTKVPKPENETKEKVCGELQRLLNQKNKKQRL